MQAAYLLSMLVGAVGFVLTFSAGLTALERWRPWRLPPPPLVNETSFDEKLLTLRGSALAPELLAVGSSMTARNLDLAALGGGALDPRRAFNGAVMNVSVNQTAYLARFYLDHFPSVRRLLVQVAPFDFRDCSSRPDDFFDRESAEQLASPETPLLTLYLRHFDPVGMLRRALTIAKQREPGGALHMDAFGFFPTTLSAKQMQIRGLRYGVQTLDDACFRALRALAELAASRGVLVTVIINPVNPRFYDLPGAAAFVAGYKAELAKALKGASARLLDANDVVELAPSDFYDAYHLQRRAAARVSRALGRRIPQD